jgi:hypothetical protein
VAGGVTHKERDFENVLIETNGTISGGDKIIVIHWKKRTCMDTKANAADSTEGNSHPGTAATVEPPPK